MSACAWGNFTRDDGPHTRQSESDKAVDDPTKRD